MKHDVWKATQMLNIKPDEVIVDWCSERLKTFGSCFSDAFWQSILVATPDRASHAPKSPAVRSKGVFREMSPSIFPFTSPKQMRLPSHPKNQAPVLFPPGTSARRRRFAGHCRHGSTGGQGVWRKPSRLAGILQGLPISCAAVWVQQCW